DRRVVLALLVLEDDLPVLRPIADRALIADHADVDHVADHAGRAAHLPAGVPLPADLAGLGVQGIEVVIDRADVDAGRRPLDVGDRRARVHLGARRDRPRDLTRVHVDAVDAGVDAAEVHAPVCDRGRGIDPAAAPEAAADGLALPLDLAGLRVDREVLARVVAAVDVALAQGEAALHGAGRLDLPLQRAVLDVHREHAAALAAEDHVLVLEDERRGLAAAGQRLAPHD